MAFRQTLKYSGVPARHVTERGSVEVLVLEPPSLEVPFPVLLFPKRLS